MWYNLGIMDQIERTVATYDEKARDYAERWYTLRLEADMACFSAWLEPGARVLDVGCGPARDTAWLAELGFRAVGADLSLGMLRQARERNTAPVIQADMRRLPFAAGSFGGLWVCASLLHVPKPQAGLALAELRRVVGDGVMYVAVKQGQGEDWLTDADGRSCFFAFYRPDEFHQILRAAGFRVLDGWLNPDAAGRETGWISALVRGTREVKP